MTAAVRRLRIRTEQDASEATRIGRDLALAVGFGRTEAVQLATAISEVAGNVVRHAGEGTVELREVARGIEVEVCDGGPGIADVELALTDGYSTGGSLGLGLPGARRLVDEFAVESSRSGGTRVTLVKWRPGEKLELLPQRLAHTVVEQRPDSPWTAVVHGFPGGLLLAVVRDGADALRARPALAPTLLLQACGDREAVVAIIGAMDGHLVWQAAPPAGARLRRDRFGAPGPHVVSAPAGRAATIGLVRGDSLVLASFPLRDTPPAGAAAAVAAALRADGPADAVVLAADVRRGVLERRPGR